MHSGQSRYLRPSFFIIGERKCATSALYRYLLDHPQVLPCRVKEPQFFSKPWWYRRLFAGRYRAMFPRADTLESTIKWYELQNDGTITDRQLTFARDPDRPAITGEASANTFADVVPEVLKAAYPDAKLILCLRHPVERAWSHYRMLRRFVQEGRRIPLQLTDFVSDFKKDMWLVQNGAKGFFAGLSLYADRFRGWSEVFGNNSIFIVKVEDLQDPLSANTVLTELCAYLDIRPFDFPGIPALNINRADPKNTLDPAMRRSLFAYYTEDVQLLEEYTDLNFNWQP